MPKQCLYIRLQTIVFVLSFILLSCSYQLNLNMHPTSFHHSSKGDRTSSTSYRAGTRPRHPSSLQALSANVDGFTEAFVGGSVGVMSAAIIVELQKLKGKGLEGCPYCLGNGMLLCATCYGAGKLSSSSCDSIMTQPLSSSSSSASGCRCSACTGQGMVKCLNCQGDGRRMPMVLQSKAVRNPDYAVNVMSAV